MSGLTVADFVERLQTRGVKLPFEIGTFIALEATELLLNGPALADADEVSLNDQGEVVLLAMPHSADMSAAAQSVCQELLPKILVAAGSGVPRHTVRLIEKGPSSGTWNLSELRDELEAALVPLNRSAAGRVLARLVRDAKKDAPKEARAGLALDPNADADLDALLASGDEPDAAVDVDVAQALSERPGAAVVDFSEVAKKRAPGSPSEVKARKRAQADRSLDRLEEVDEPRRSNGGSKTWLWALLLVLAVGAAYVAIARPDLIESVIGNRDSRESSGEPAEEAPEPEEEAEAEPALVRGDLSVQVNRERAEVFLKLGDSPAEIDGLPIGVGYEVLVIGEGRAAVRETIMGSEAWPEGRLVRAVSISEESREASANLDLGSSRLTAENIGEPTGESGSLRIETDSPAEVYLLVGFGSANVRDLPTNEPVELLIGEPGFRTANVDVATESWSEASGRATHSLEITLEAISE